MPTTLITGSASGIGAATRQLLQSAGHEVVGVDLRNADINGDLSSPEGRQQVLEALHERLGGRLDSMVLCAGLGPQVKPESLISSVNYFGAVELLDGLLPLLRGGQSPAVVVISSTASVAIDWETNPLAAAFEDGDEVKVSEGVMAAGDQAGYLAYSASKNALTVAVRRRVRAWGQAGVRLNSIAPGATQTPLLQAGMQDERFSQAIHDYVSPLGRNAEPSEIAAAAAFLLSPQASFIHGAQLFVDGGIDAQTRPTRF
ncbi:SDR family oxidoreductase [Pseudomonas sp. BN417]|uniref:SDR family oxidoreductase n=1 Tax=Pseudomonas sp. BN417 TaxID=2567890 RepID=UPI0024559429|nr:SDR family oxidoreductase [Pseudomonas sp. BN417]MDH4555141.1 SDR family oxidoreductase [Pseudomonas sp. BN417]